MEQVGDAAAGVAASPGLAAIGIADAHQNLGRGVARRLEQNDLIASDAGPPIREPACGCGAERDRAAAKIEHDKIVAEPVHFEKRDLAHRAAYMAAGSALSNAAETGRWTGRAVVSSPYNEPHRNSRVWRSACRASRSSP